MELEPVFIGRTYSDFLFRPQKGRVVSRRMVALTTRLAGQLDLNIPVLAANMDSVTEGDMAKTMALEGGIGIIHRAMPIDAQTREVRRVKRSHGYIVENPLCLPRAATIREAREFIREHDITGILIEEEIGGKRLAGLLSNRDIPWIDGFEDQKVEDFMTPVQRLTTRPPGISVEAAEQIMYENRIEKLPLIDDNRRIQGLITKKDIILYRQRPYSSKDEKGRLLVGAAIGARGDYLERATDLIGAGVDILVIDIAHGHSEVMREAVENFRRRFGTRRLICGNVGTAAGALFLKEVGADAIKVGIGPGRGCRTRLETGAGVPQLQAIREAWCAVGESVPIVADGGITDDKDIFMALMVGASTVMLGSMLSATDQAPGRVFEDPKTHEKKKIYRGMTSPQAVLEALYGLEPEAVTTALSTPAEGQEIQVPYKGSVVDILHRICGHLRSAVSYAGEDTLAEARKKIVQEAFKYLVPLSAASRQESYLR
ncbi:MAG: IMP dehydrogenase [Acidobacteriota bacterium]